MRSVLNWINWIAPSGPYMKITSAKRKQIALAYPVAASRVSPIDEERTKRIARTAAYLDATREQFAAKARAASKHLAGRVEGVLAGPTTRR